MFKRYFRFLMLFKFYYNMFTEYTAGRLQKKMLSFFNHFLKIK